MRELAGKSYKTEKTAAQKTQRFDRVKHLPRAKILRNIFFAPRAVYPPNSSVFSAFLGGMP
jgi:hypothetical protein